METLNTTWWKLYWWSLSTWDGEGTPPNYIFTEARALADAHYRELERGDATWRG